MIDEKEIKKLKNEIINNYTKNELAESLIVYCSMIFDLIEDHKGNYSHSGIFKKYEKRAYETTGLKIKYY